MVCMALLCLLRFLSGTMFFLQGSFSTVQFSLCRISTTLHWSRYNSREWQPNGPLKPPSPVCLIAAGRHYVDFRLEFALSLTGDSGDSSREPRCPYQVARKYLRRSVPGLISSKGLLRDFWKRKTHTHTTVLVWVMLMSRRRRQAGRRSGRGEMGCCFCLQDWYLLGNKMPAVLLLTMRDRECCWESAHFWKPGRLKTST